MRKYAFSDYFFEFSVTHCIHAFPDCFFQFSQLRHGCSRSNRVCFKEFNHLVLGLLKNISSGLIYPSNLISFLIPSRYQELMGISANRARARESERVRDRPTDLVMLACIEVSTVCKYRIYIYIHTYIYIYAYIYIYTIYTCT